MIISPRRPLISQLMVAGWLALASSSGVVWHRTAVAATPTSLEQSLAVLQKIGAKAEGHAEAVRVWNDVAQASPDALPTILASMNDSNPLATNWVRAAVDAIAERALAAGKPLPIDALDKYLADTKNHSPRSRRLAYEWLVQADPGARERWITKLLNDPSLELRRDAVAEQLTRADAALAAEKKDDARNAYVTALQSARDLDQIETAAKALRGMGDTVDLPKHFGFVMNWQLIGPFDNRNTVGFDRSYPPEEKIDLQSDYPGLNQVVKWSPATTTNEYGEFDLNELLGKHKGAIAYAVAEFESDQARPVELRLGCINANKVWLNGNLVISNHVYHANSAIDQYVGQGQLQAGKNVILVKICQNEQTESWAQDWKFQLRVCDELGTAVLPVAKK